MRFHFFALLSFSLLTFASQEEQIVMNNAGESTFIPLTKPQPSLADLLTIEPSASIFYSYARELELSAKFDDASVRYTIFVPTNKAVMALARKPHQGPDDDYIRVSREEFDRRSRSNVERWVSAHIVPKHPITLESHHDTLLPSKSITFTSTAGNGDEEPEWSHVALEDGIRIIGKKEGLNGVLYLIDGAISSE